MTPRFAIVTAVLLASASGAFSQTIPIGINWMALDTALNHGHLRQLFDSTMGFNMHHARYTGHQSDAKAWIANGGTAKFIIENLDRPIDHFSSAECAFGWSRV